MRSRGKFEVPLVIVALLVVGAWLMSIILDNSVAQKFIAFKYSANAFATIVSTNLDTFNNSKIIYLEEVIDEELIGNIRSPFSSNNCDVKESKIEIDDSNQRYITLKCDDYLIEHVNQNTINGTDYYEVGQWSEKNNKSYEKKILYNCIENGKVLFNNYTEKDYFIYRINKKYNSNYNSIGEINICEIQSMNFYRSKKEIMDKSN